jgi:hypothetical protein
MRSSDSPLISSRIVFHSISVSSILFFSIVIRVLMGLMFINIYSETNLGVNSSS